MPEDQRVDRRRIGAEVWIVLGLSLGQAAVYAVVRLYARLTVEIPLAQQATTLNPTRAERPYLDLTYQLLGIGFALVPVALALYLLSERGRGTVQEVRERIGARERTDVEDGSRAHLGDASRARLGARARLGLDGARPGHDLAVGLALAAMIGLPGLAFYAVGRALGLNVQINASGLDAYWWTVPVLLLSALQNALLEEVVAVGYLVERLGELRWSMPAILAASALLRGAYHLYQGPGMAVGNVLMGLLLGWYYLRRRRVMPLVVAHTTLDVVAFVGYALLPEELLATLRLT